MRKGLRKKENEELMFNGYRVSIWVDEKIGNGKL